MSEQSLTVLALIVGDMNSGRPWGNVDFLKHMTKPGDWNNHCSVFGGVVHCFNIWKTLLQNKNHFPQRGCFLSLSLKFLRSTWSFYCVRSWEKSRNIYYIAQ